MQTVMLFAILAMSCLLESANSFAITKILSSKWGQVTSQINGAASTLQQRGSFFRMMATKEAMPKLDAISDGMFTMSSPETKRVVPTNLEGKRK